MDDYSEKSEPSQNSETPMEKSRRFSLVFGKNKLMLMFNPEEKHAQEIIECCSKIEQLHHEGVPLQPWMDAISFSEFIDSIMNPMAPEKLEWSSLKRRLWYSSYFGLPKYIQKFFLDEALPNLSNGVAYALGYEINKKLLQSPNGQVGWIWVFGAIKCRQFILFGVTDIHSLVFANKAIDLHFNNALYSFYLSQLVANERLFNIYSKSRRTAELVLNYLFGASDLFHCLQATSRMDYDISNENLNLVTWRVPRALFQNQEAVRSRSFLMGDHYFFFQVSMLDSHYAICLVYDRSDFQEGAFFAKEPAEPTISYFQDAQFQVLSFLGRIHIANGVSSNDFGFSMVAKEGYSLRLARLEKVQVEAGCVPSVFVNLKHMGNLAHTWLLMLLILSSNQLLKEKKEDILQLSPSDFRVFLEYLRHRHSRLPPKQASLENCLAHFEQHWNVSQAAQLLLNIFQDTKTRPRNEDFDLSSSDISNCERLPNPSLLKRKNSEVGQEFGATEYNALENLCITKAELVGVKFLKNRFKFLKEPPHSEALSQINKTMDMEALSLKKKWLNQVALTNFLLV